MRFVGLALEDWVPDGKTIGLYRAQLIRAGAIERLLHHDAETPAGVGRDLGDHDWPAECGSARKRTLNNDPRLGAAADSSRVARSWTMPELLSIGLADGG